MLQLSLRDYPRSGIPTNWWAYLNPSESITQRRINMKALEIVIHAHLARQYNETLRDCPESLPPGEEIAASGLPVMGREEWVEENFRDVMRRVL
jgi:hypothetical protein